MMTSAMELEGLTSLAILKVNWDERDRKNYLDNFMPFVEEALRELKTDDVTSPELQESLHQLTGLEIPQGVVRTLLGRAQKNGYVRHVGGTYVRNPDALQNDGLEAKATDFRRQTEALVEKLREFVCEEFDLDWQPERAEKLVLDYVRRAAAPLLRATRYDATIRVEEDDTERIDYAISAFIEYSLEKDPEAIQYLENIAKGSMLASAVYYQNPSTATQKLQDVRVYFDTPFLLYALGVNGTEQEGAYREIIQLLREAGAELRVFDSTVSEIRGILDSKAGQLRSERDKRVPRSSNPVQSTLPPSDLRILSQTLKKQLRELGIRAEPRPEFEEWLSLDEADLQDRLLEEAYSESSPSTLRHDVNALLSIHRLRKGNTPGRLANAEAVFVTTNSYLSRRSKEFFCDELGPAARDAPHCMLHDDIATRAWLVSPNAAPDLPRKQLVSYAFAALEPGEEVWKKYIEELDRLKESDKISAEDYLYFRSSEGIGRALADATMNDPEVFTEATVEEIRKRREQEIRAEAEEEKEKQKQRAEREEQRAEKEAERRKQQEERAQKEEQRADREQQRRHRREKRDRKRARRAGWWTGWVVWGLLVISLLAAAWFTLPEIPSEESPDWKRVGGAIIFFLIGLGLAISALFNSYSISRKIADAIEERVLRFLQPELTIGSGEIERES
jgi:hypothetical protein